MSPTLENACREFEVALIRDTFGHALFATTAAVGETDGEGGGPERGGAVAGSMQALCADAFARAIERAGGLGIGRSLAAELQARR